MVNIFTKGGCYQFFVILKIFEPRAEPYKVDYAKRYKNKDQGNINDFPPTHIVAKIDNNFYDINGLFELKKSPYKRIDIMTEKDIKKVEKYKYIGS